MRFLSLRAVFLFGFVIAMPVLALPPVARRIDTLLYGPAPTGFGQPPGAAAPALTPPTSETFEMKHASPVSPTRFDEPSPAAQVAAAGYESQVAPPPPQVPTQFTMPSPSAPTASGSTEPAPLDERTMERLQQIRQRLEQLGAEYVVVETQDSGRYRFHCRMLVDERSRFTRPFDASSFDPIAAGQQVLREVEAWRLAASDPRQAAVR
jgi:hypothetical protein